MKTLSASRIEALESRISPAALNLAGTILTYTDIDGDAVKVTFTHAKMAAGDFLFSAGSVDGSTTTPQSLDTLRLLGKTGAGFTLTATPNAGKGDSHANIGLINGTNTDVGTISVDGNVGTINVGTGAAGTVGLKSFMALSMGSASTGGGSSNIGIANAGSFVVKGDLMNAVLNFTGGVKALTIGGNVADLAGGTGLEIAGDVGTLKIGGSLFAGSATTPSLHVTGKVGALSIGGSVVGGPFNLSNGQHQVEIAGNVKTLTVGGDLVGGPGDGSGAIRIVNDVTSAKIGGLVRGGGGINSGTLFILGKTNSFTLGGSLLGGSGPSSGALNFDDGIGAVKIGGSIIGGTGSFSGNFSALSVKSLAIGHNLQAIDNPTGATLDGEGSISVTGNIGSLSIGGDFISGRSVGGGKMDQSGEIGATGTIGSVKIGGSIYGDPGHLAYLSAGANGTTGVVNAIGSITVQGNVESASLLAGYGFFYATRYNHDSGIGSISIGGNLTGSYITAGSSAGTDGIPGNRDDLIDGAAAIIGSLKIGGALTGLDAAGHPFYIQSSIINKVTIGKATYTHAQIKGAPGNVLDFNAIGDVVIASPH